MSAHEARQRGVPAGYRIYPSDVKDNDLLLREEPVVHGGDVADAQAAFDERTNLPIVTFRFNAAGANKFASFTRNNIGRPFAVVVDGRVVTAPVIQSPILGGVGQISGNFTPASAAQLAARIRSGTCVEFSRLPSTWTVWHRVIREPLAGSAEGSLVFGFSAGDRPGADPIVWARIHRRGWHRSSTPHRSRVRYGRV